MMLILGAGGGVMALMAIVLFIANSKPPPPPPRALAVQKPAPPTSADILIAARDISEGVRPSQADFFWQNRELALVTESDIRRDRDPNAIEQLSDRYTLTQIFAQDEVRREDFQFVEAGVLAGLLKVGERAYTVTLDNRTSHVGFLAPGDRVDVLLTQNNKTSTVLQDVKVLAVDRQHVSGEGSRGNGNTWDSVEPQPGGNTTGGKRSLNARYNDRGDRYAAFITLATDFKGALALASAQNAGIISFPLRNPFDHEIESVVKHAKDTRKHIWMLQGGNTIYRQCNPFCDVVLNAQSVIPNRPGMYGNPGGDPYSDARNAITDTFSSALEK